MGKLLYTANRAMLQILLRTNIESRRGGIWNPDGFQVLDFKHPAPLITALTFRASRRASLYIWYTRFKSLRDRFSDQVLIYNV